MSIGLIGLLDDVAGIAKAAAASLDDVASQAAKAGAKAVGVVIDDAGMEMAEAFSAPPPEYLRSLKGRPYANTLPMPGSATATAGLINLRIVGSSVSMSATYLGTIEHGAQGY
jgi:Protein of unknown function (DUF808)